MIHHDKCEAHIRIIKIKEEYLIELEAQLEKAENEVFLRGENFNKVRAQLEKAENVLEELIMSNDHAGFCRFREHVTEYEKCVCMDRNIFNTKAITQKAREYFESKLT